MIPDLSVVWVIVFVLLLSVLLDRLLLRPLTRIMRDRASAIATARNLAEASRAKAQAAAEEFEARTRAARADVYRQMDDARRTALERRTALVADTRRDIEATLADATARLRAQAHEASARLDRDADDLASTIVERVLGRKAS